MVLSDTIPLFPVVTAPHCGTCGVVGKLGERTCPMNDSWPFILMGQMDVPHLDDLRSSRRAPGVDPGSRVIEACCASAQSDRPSVRRFPSPAH